MNPFVVVVCIAVVLVGAGHSAASSYNISYFAVTEDHVVDEFVKQLQRAGCRSVFTAAAHRPVSEGAFAHRGVVIDHWIRLRAAVRVLGQYVVGRNGDQARGDDVARFAAHFTAVWTLRSASGLEYDQGVAVLDRVLDQHAVALRRQLFPQAELGAADLSRNMKALGKMLREDCNRISLGAEALKKSWAESVPAVDLGPVLSAVEGSLRTMTRCEQLAALAELAVVPFEERALSDPDFLWSITFLNMAVPEIERIHGVPSTSAILLIAYKIILAPDGPVRYDPADLDQLISALVVLDPYRRTRCTSTLFMPLHIQVQLYMRAMAFGDQVCDHGRRAADAVLALAQAAQPGDFDLRATLFLVAILYRLPGLDLDARTAVLAQYVEHLRYEVVPAADPDAFVLALAYHLSEDGTNAGRIAKRCVAGLVILTQAPLRMRMPKDADGLSGTEIVSRWLDAVIRGSAAEAVTASTARDVPSSLCSSSSGGGTGRLKRLLSRRSKEKLPCAKAVVAVLTEYL